MPRLPALLHSAAILCSALLCLASAHTVEPTLQPLPDPAPPPEPPDWSLVLLPGTDWTPKEAAKAAKLLSRIQPDMIVAAKRFEWLAEFQKDHSGCQILAMDEPARMPKAQSPAFLSCSDASSVHRISTRSPVPASLLRMRTVPSGQYNIGPRPASAEHNAILIARTRQAFAKMSGDVLFLFKGSHSWLANSRNWFWPHKNWPATTKITHPVLIDWSSLATPTQ